MRERLSLDGYWQFRIDPHQNLTPELLEQGGAETIEVPGCWQAQFPGLRHYEGRAWYWRRFTVPSAWQGRRVVLHFGAVDYLARVWLNGTELGMHEGGYTPFEFELQDHLNWDEENLLVVRVDDPPRVAHAPSEYLFSEIPHGKEDWYTRVSGIWQSVWIERRGLVDIRTVHVTPDLDTATAHVRIYLAHLPLDGDPAQLTLRCRITSPDGRHVFEAFTRLAAEQFTYDLPIRVDPVVPWDLHAPALYRATVTVAQGEDPIDELTVEFGMRKVETRDNLIYLNGRPIFLIGALDQDFYPRTIFTPPSDEFLRDQFQKAKHMGLNLLRCHIKVPDPRYLEWADRLGLLVWAELPSWGSRLTERSKRRAEQTLFEMIDRDYNHPSIIIWTIVNEDWGAQIRTRAEDRAWLKDFFERVKQRDPSRLVVDNSPCNSPYGPSFHVKSDIQDFHMYCSIPDQQQRWADFVEAFALNAAWTFSPYGDGEPTGKEPLIVSEFGTWGLPSLRQLRAYYGADPWWWTMGLPAVPELEHVIPAGAEERFHEYKLDRIFGSFEDFILATQRHQFYALKTQIEEMRRHPSIAGYVITEFTDLHWECNGLLDMLRNPKVFYNELSTINTQDLLIVRTRTANFWEGQHFTADILFSHFADRDVEGATLLWAVDQLGLNGVIHNVSAARATVSVIGRIEFDVPPLEESLASRIEVTLLGRDRSVLASNYLDVYFYPAAYRRPRATGRVSVYDPHNRYGLADRLRGLGYVVYDGPVDRMPLDSVAIVTAINRRVADFIRRGGRVLYLARGFNPFVPVLTREGTGYSGDWITNFNWLKREPLFERIPFEHILGAPFRAVAPEHVMLGFGPDDADDTLGGMVVGWVHLPAALLGQFRHQQGKVLITTFNLEEQLGIDPVATIMLHELVAYAESPAFQPKKVIDPWSGIPARGIAQRLVAG
jgi:hypothetical protein